METWNEYTEKEKYAICLCLLMFIQTLEDDLHSPTSIGFMKDISRNAMKKLMSYIEKEFVKNRNMNEYMDSYSIGDGTFDEYVRFISNTINCMTPTKIDKIFHFLVKTRNDFDILLIHGRINSRDFIYRLCSSVKYKLDNSVFN
jgi:hypothetical protein